MPYTYVCVRRYLAMFPPCLNRFLASICWALIFGAVLSINAAPVRDPAAAGNDCVACHKGDDPKAQSPLPAKHKSTKTMKLADCFDCHEKRTDDTLITKLTGSHLHQLAGVSCVDCHGSSGKPAPVEMEQCLSCHKSGEKVAALTAKLKPQNPHFSAHYNSDLDCNLCHHQHQKSENYCSECHRWDFKVP